MRGTDVCWVLPKCQPLCCKLYNNLSPHVSPRVGDCPVICKMAEKALPKVAQGSVTDSQFNEWKPAKPMLFPQ